MWESRWLNNGDRETQLSLEAMPSVKATSTLNQI
jgi:hypothetical protein